jgi:hypothetical protein
MNRETGVVSLEMALVMPLLLLMVVGAITLGHAQYVRYNLSSGADRAARACALDQALPEQCEALARQMLTGTSGWCDPLEVTAQYEPLPGLQRAIGLRVQVECSYVGGVGQTFLKNNNISIADFTISALMPTSPQEW